MYYFLIQCLRLVKLFHEIGIKKTVGDIGEITEDDYLELALRGLEHVAPDYMQEELGDDVCCGGHVMHWFSDPAVPEYYRLCRLYEFKHSITPEENPYVTAADDFYVFCLNQTSGGFNSNYDDERHPRAIWIETCPERCDNEYEIIVLVHNVMEYYKATLETLRAELLRGPLVFLPALPEHKKQEKAKETRTRARNPMRKAG